MDFIPRLLGAISVVLFAIGITDRNSASAPVTIPTTSVVVITTTTTIEPAPTHAANDSIPPTSRCGMWWGLATQLGWHADSMPTLDYVMWRESRCDPTQHNTTRNKDGSTDIGLTQINDRSWCLPTRWYPKGYLQTIGVLSTVGCNELFDPATNLKAAKAIYDYSQEHNDNGFQPWGL